MKHSHLSVESQQGKPYPFKALCEFCYYAYDIDKSDAVNPKLYCSNECQITDEWIEAERQ